MLKKITPHTKFLPTYLTALFVLFSLGFAYPGNADFQKVRASFSKIESLKKLSTDATLISEKKNTSSLPEEFPLTIEEQEEDTDDDKYDDALILGWIPYGHNPTEQLSTAVYDNFTDCSQPPTVPLYILFHSWKSFIS